VGCGERQVPPKKEAAAAGSRLGSHRHRLPGAGDKEKYRAMVLADNFVTPLDLLSLEAACSVDKQMVKSQKCLDENDIPALVSPSWF
jgi:hypothetical protein